MLVLHQRYALMELSEEVTGRWPVSGAGTADEGARERAFREIRQRLLAFTARGYFAQVTQREHHHRVYRKWQAVFEVDRLYREVADEIREMFEYSLLERTERLEALQREAAEREKAAEAERRRQREEEERQREALRAQAEEHNRRAEERARRLETWLGILAGIFGVPGLVLAYLDAVAGRLDVSPAETALYAVIGFCAGILMLIVIRRVSAR